MKVRVFALRRAGRRISDRGNEGVAGDLRFSSVVRGGECVTSAHLLEKLHLSSRDSELLPPLYQPVLVTVGESSLLLRGFERTEGGAGVVQEWHCVISG